ncbi:MAG: hypothetical protein EOO92_06925 [Pedobacter sp.]|nr:MAG: hypothetical protein EOO92_06925 [Pedobacter sp.]
MIQKIKKTSAILFPALFVLAFYACSTSYKLEKTNREAYHVDKDVSADSSIIKTYLPYKAQMEAEMNQVIGHSAVLMSKKSSDTLPESLLSNFFSDAVMNQALKIDPTIDFGIPSTKGGLRVDIPKGEITVSNIFETMPFENETVVYQLTGIQVKELLNFVASTNGQPVVGLQLKIKDKKLVDVKIKGKDLDPAETYKVLTSDYIGGGGDKVPVFKDIALRKTLGLKIRDALLKEVKEKEAAGQLLSPKLDGRITKL